MLIKINPPPGPTDYSTIVTRDDFHIKISPEDYDALSKFSWFIKWSNHLPYACRKIVRDGKEIIIRMHSQITGCKWPNETHHINKNTLDNRRENLLCCSKLVHRMHHGKA